MASNFDKRMGIKGTPREMIKNNPYVQAITKVKREKYFINSPQRDARATFNLKVFTYLEEIFNMNRKKCIIHTDSI